MAGMPPGLNRLFAQAIEHTTSESLHAHAAAPSTLTPERRAFLEAAMQEITYDVPTKMKECIGTLKDAQSSPEQLAEALEALQFECEQIDAANDLPKLDGLAPVLHLLRHPDADVRMHAAWLLGTTLQHNPPMQELVLQTGVLPDLVRSLATEPEVRVSEKVLMVVSAFVRHHPAALRVFRDTDGYAQVLRLAGAAGGSVKNRRKASFVLARLLTPEENDISLVVPVAPALWGGLHTALAEECAGEGDVDVLTNLLDCTGLLAALVPPSNLREIRAAVRSCAEKRSEDAHLGARVQGLLEELK